MIKKFDDLTVVEFGNGTVTVELGKYGNQYAVFINNTDTPGIPGQLAPKTKNSRGYEPDEIVLVLPSKKRATEVVNSLFNGELVKVGGRQQPAPDVAGLDESPIDASIPTAVALAEEAPQTVDMASVT